LLSHIDLPFKLLGQVKTFHILLDAIQLSLSQISPSSVQFHLPPSLYNQSASRSCSTSPNHLS